MKKMQNIGTKSAFMPKKICKIIVNVALLVE